MSQNSKEVKLNLTVDSTRAMSVLRAIESELERIQSTAASLNIGSPESAGQLRQLGAMYSGLSSAASVLRQSVQSGTPAIDIGGIRNIIEDSAVQAYKNPADAISMLSQAAGISGEGVVRASQKPRGRVPVLPMPMSVAEAISSATSQIPVNRGEVEREIPIRQHETAAASMLSELTPSAPSTSLGMGVPLSPLIPFVGSDFLGTPPVYPGGPLSSGPQVPRPPLMLPPATRFYAGPGGDIFDVFGPPPPPPPPPLALPPPPRFRVYPDGTVVDSFASSVPPIPLVTQGGGWGAFQAGTGTTAQVAQASSQNWAKMSVRSTLLEKIWANRRPADWQYLRGILGTDGGQIIGYGFAGMTISQYMSEYINYGTQATLAGRPSILQEAGFRGQLAGSLVGGALGLGIGFLAANPAFGLAFGAGIGGAFGQAVSERFAAERERTAQSAVSLMPPSYSLSFLFGIDKGTSGRRSVFAPLFTPAAFDSILKDWYAPGSLISAVKETKKIDAWVNKIKGWQPDIGDIGITRDVWEQFYPNLSEGSEILGRYVSVLMKAGIDPTTQTSGSFLAPKEAVMSPTLKRKLQEYEQYKERNRPYEETYYEFVTKKNEPYQFMIPYLKAVGGIARGIPLEETERGSRPDTPLKSRYFMDPTKGVYVVPPGAGYAPTQNGQQFAEDVHIVTIPVPDTIIPVKKRRTVTPNIMSLEEFLGSDLSMELNRYKSYQSSSISKEMLYETLTRRTMEHWLRGGPEAQQAILPLISSIWRHRGNLADYLFEAGPEIAHKFSSLWSEATQTGKTYDLRKLIEWQGKYLAEERGEEEASYRIRGAAKALADSRRLRMELIEGIPGGAESLLYAKSKKAYSQALLQQYHEEDTSNFMIPMAIMEGEKTRAAMMPYGPGNVYGKSLQMLGMRAAYLNTLQQRYSTLMADGLLSEADQYNMIVQIEQLKTANFSDIASLSEGVDNRIPALSAGGSGWFGRFDTASLAAANIGYANHPSRFFGATSGLQAKRQRMFLQSATEGLAMMPPVGQTQTMDSPIIASSMEEMVRLLRSINDKMDSKPNNSIKTRGTGELPPSGGNMQTGNSAPFNQ